MVQKVKFNLTIEAELVSAEKISHEEVVFGEIDFIPLVKNWKTYLSKKVLCMPAAHDLHVHFREPGFEHKETIQSGSLAALYGGCTTVLDMPNTNPPTITVKEYLRKKEIGKNEIVNLLVAAGIADNNLSEIKSLASVADCWKVYLDNSFNAVPCTIETLNDACSILENEENNKPIFIHAMQTTEGTEGKQTIDEENAGIELALNLAKEFGNLNFHITHLSNVSALEKIIQKKYHNVTHDTCPRYFMKKTAKEQLQRCNPPIRSLEEQAKLKKSVYDGEIFMLTTDHAPHTLVEKEEGAPGCPGVQEMFPQMINWSFEHEGIDKRKIVKMVHENPKRLMRRKEETEDYVIIAPQEDYQINHEWIKSKCDWSLYQSEIWQGKIIGIISQKC
ncbi:MAG: dihydroorotase family protein [Candidatus Heimdallarchaeota archaeon]|nr:dihydroorotase family protein [Candidatus Heimdallarchaeota archaeon]MCK5048541.1 dihydroorotase family protein [Candidatus Heimdallarchaeota archaeon]